MYIRICAKSGDGQVIFSHTEEPYFFTFGKSEVIVKCMGHFFYSFLLPVHPNPVWWNALLTIARQLGRCLKVLKSGLELWLGRRRQ